MHLTHEITVKTSKGMQRLQTLHINIHEGYSNYTITGSTVTIPSYDIVFTQKTMKMLYCTAATYDIALTQYCLPCLTYGVTSGIVER